MNCMERPLQPLSQERCRPCRECRVWTVVVVGILMLAAPQPLRAQTDEPWVNYYNAYITFNDVEDNSLEDTYEVLSDLYAHPVDLNAATRSDLAQLPFLSAQQISSILAYRDQYGPLRSLNELLLIPGLDYVQSHLLSFFVRLEAPQRESPFPRPSALLHGGRNDFTAYLKVPFYTRDGDRKGFLGYRYKHWLKWTYGYADRVRLGLTASQDAGEPFFEGRNRRGYDYLTGYVDVRKIGWLRQAVVGRYRLRTGMGLVLNNDFGFGKLMLLSTLGRGANSLRGHGSRSEDGYLQGAAATVRPLPWLDVTAFISRRRLDGTLAADSTSICAIVSGGYHRTRTEMDKKHNTSQTAGGGHVLLHTSGFHLGLTAFGVSLSRRLAPSEQAFRRYYPRGDRFWNVSADYGYASRRLSVSGETATGDCHAVATLNSVSLQALSNLQLILLQRFYSYRFYSLFSRSFSDGGRIQNESGLFAGLQWSPWRNVDITAYADYAYHPWARYQASWASRSWDVFMRGAAVLGSWRMALRWRMRRRQRDNAEHTALEPRAEHRGRLQVGYGREAWSLRWQTDVAQCSQRARSFGWMTSVMGDWQPRRFRLQALAGLFHTQDYNSRVYCADPPLLYSFLFPVFEGRGWHGVVSATWKPTQDIALTLRSTLTKYFDRSAIGSSYTRIQGSSAPYMEVQARVRIWNRPQQHQ